MFIKKSLPLIVTFVIGIAAFLGSFSPHPAVTKFTFTLPARWLTIIGSIAFVSIGLISVLRVHISKIQRQVPGWGYSMVLLITLFSCLVIGLIWGYKPTTGKLIPLNWVYLNIFAPLGASMFAILGFYIITASYRGFRARSFEAFLFLLAGTIVLIGQTPLGTMLWNELVRISSWILDVPNLAAKRALTFGLALAGIALSIRIILSIDKIILGGTKD